MEGGGTYVNTGHMFIRFSEVKYMKEIEEKVLKYGNNAAAACAAEGGCA